MGVPKFYRWISERYPCLSEVVREFQLPEFDNLYLDMNGIIHVCSHPDDENPHFRITEEKIFKDICHYIDFLFRMIKPKKVFFMAVDGVAPRAKMNQQRGRRFRSAREAESLIKKAEEKGEVLPTEKRFDSNCITPGTPFMVKLQEHLKYFVVDKITNDPVWQGPKIYLSGHETPGEGEHKVMDYIRYSKSQLDYDPDTRHCLYGLDADLIMLGLTSHDPHFSLLREEVRFGGKKDRNKRPATPEETTFHLLHLSLMRDYLAYEFSPLKDKLPFPWDLEQIIDDWILMGFLVGNDFIPHLPHLHIHHDALPLLWKTYMKVLPTLDGYINEGGHLNLPRFEKYFQELSKFDEETFESAFSDLRFLESKIGGKSINESIGSSKGGVPMKKLRKFKVKQNGSRFSVLEDESVSKTVLSEEDTGSDDDSDADDEDEDDGDEEDYSTFGDEFKLHKRDYYMTKMDYSEVTPEVLEDQAHGYVKAIQWILLYYFEGCPSWSWFYPHHYAPYISDVKGFSNMKITFELSQPFLPFQQLMAVLPAASKDLLPPALQPLMTDSNSPVLDFYPVNFETDLNGKQQDWEAVVLIPFIEENRLLVAMAAKEPLLTQAEKDRNKHGPHLMYQYTTENTGLYHSPQPEIFPDIHYCRANLVELEKDLFHIESSKLRKGLLDTFRLNVYFPGFPVLRFLPHTHELAKVGVKVFQHNSRGENMVLRVQAKEGLHLEEVADELLGSITHVGWPHLHEAKVVAVANESFRIDLVEDIVKRGKQTAISFNRRKLEKNEGVQIASEATAIKERHMDRFAIDVGKTEIVIYVRPMTGKLYTYGPQGAIILEKQFATRQVPHLHQMTVKELEVEESDEKVFTTLGELFPEDSAVFMVGAPHYGTQGKVKEILPDVGRVRIVLNVMGEPDFRKLQRNGSRSKYLNNYQAAQQIGIDAHALSRITGTVFVEKAGPNGGRVNVGLNLKFTKRGEEVPGYTRKTPQGWSYNFKCIKIVEEYINRFPDLWLTIQKQSGDLDIYKEEQLFPEGCGTKLADIVKYLEELPCTKAPRMKFGSEILDEDQIREIEEMTGKLNPTPLIVKMKVKPRLLFRPLDNQGSLVPDPGTDFRLYDRVVVVKSGYSVPFGKRGTIIGLPSEEDGGITPNSLYDIVFDEPFTGGITLRCTPGKGYRVPGSAMLSITYGEFRKDCTDSPQVQDGRGEHSHQGNRLSNQKDGYRNSGGYNNNRTEQQPYNDRAGQYPDRTALWKQQQYQFQQQPVQWEKGQPLFGQIFAGQGQPVQGMRGEAQPRFIAPKMKEVPKVLTNPRISKSSQKNHEFDNMWKIMQSNQSSVEAQKSSNPGSQLVSEPQPGPVQPTLMFRNSGQPQAGTLSGAGLLPTPGALLSTASNADKESTPPVVQSLFDNASKARPGPENAEFLAMLSSLKTQSEEVKREARGSQISEPVSSTVSGTTADLALKQLLKIGVDMPAASEAQAGAESQSPRGLVGATPADAVTSHAPAQSNKSSSQAYGRQVSLQELFQGVNQQQQQQSASAQENRARQQSVPASIQRPDAKSGERRDPVVELEAYCKTIFSKGTPYFECKIQPRQQNRFIADVILPNGQRFQGSLCSTEEEAEKSAASMAMLCMNTKLIPNHPVITNFMPGAQRPNINRIFSSNSAFSPIGMPVNTTRLLTPQHFVNQPPPSLPVHQLIQQQQQRQGKPSQPQWHQHHHQQQNLSHGHGGQSYVQEHHTRHSQQRGSQSRSPRSFQTSQASVSGSSATVASIISAQAPTSTSTSAISQQFIPLQVSRNQKMPSKRKDSGGEKSESHSDSAATKSGQNVGQVASKRLGEAEGQQKDSSSHSRMPESGSDMGIKEKDSAGESKESGDKNGVVPGACLSPVSTLSTSTVSSSKSATPTGKSAQRKKKSRLAANFGGKSS